MSSEKTEAPTPKRLSDARTDGQVARSIEMNAAIALLVGAWLLQISGPRLIGDLSQLMVHSLTDLPRGDFSLQWYTDLLVGDLLIVLPGVAIIAIVLLVTGVTVTLGQTGFLFAVKRMQPDLTRLNPLTGFKRLLSLQSLVDLVKALLKLIVIGWVAYSVLEGQVPALLSLAQTDLLTALGQWAGLAATLVIRVGAAYLVLALIDYGYQRWDYTRRLKMSKEEIKEEMKQREGDPTVKSRIRSKQRRMAVMRMMSKVPKADVVVTNPTHLALAIQYDAGSMSAPRLLAKGADHVAERIVAIARQHNIPIVQNIPLARAIFRTVELDQEIPPALYMTMAEVLAYVYKLRPAGKKPLNVSGSPSQPTAG